MLSRTIALMAILPMLMGKPLSGSSTIEDSHLAVRGEESSDLLRPMHEERAVVHKRQTSRDAIVRRMNDPGRSVARRQLASGQTSTCVSDTSPAVAGNRGAVFVDYYDSITFTTLATQTATDITACAKFCAATSGCNFGFISGNSCFANTASNVGTLSKAPTGFDQLFYQGSTCATIKGQNGNSGADCCNLYYS